MPGPDPAGPEELALLQYTSGSTTQPRGVMLSHRALLANQEMLRRHFAVEPGNTLVSWLPTYHDMGLCLGILQPLYSGAQAVVMAPETFVMRPERWLRALSGRPGAMTAAPDTAYAWCTRRTREAAKTGLDLSGWRVAITGAEPIRPETLRGFQSAFGGCGLPATAATPAYGLAEATLFVTSSPADAPPTVRSYARDALAAGRAEEAAGVELVSCGEPAPGVEIAIVDPATLHVLPPRRVGEIWVRSPANGTGYWGRPELSRETFDVRLKSHGRGWLRTGDLGFLDGPELFVTGRRKDVIVVNGANYHPQDFEVLATAAHPLFDGELAVACWTGERVTILVEAADRTDPGALTTAAAAAVRAVTAELPVDTEVVAVTRGRIPRTTSGKPRRHECARRFRDGEVPVLTRWPQRKRLPDTG
ncbi:AMP-binding protein [Amycolatopsis solani]|nr:AMP-binding protein [Amycolatopsis sp. MEP2-6]